MTLQDTIRDGVCVVTVAEESLDAGNVTAFRQSMAPFLDEHPKMVLNLHQTRFLDSSGLGAILSCLRHVKKAGGDLVLCDVSQPVRSLFELVRMHRVFRILDCVDEAVAALR